MLVLSLGSLKERQSAAFTRFDEMLYVSMEWVAPDGSVHSVFVDGYRWCPREGWRASERPDRPASWEDVRASMNVRLYALDFSDRASDSVLESTPILEVLLYPDRPYVLLSVMGS